MGHIRRGESIYQRCSSLLLYNEQVMGKKITNLVLECLIQLEKISTDKNGVKELQSSPSRLQRVKGLLIKRTLSAVGLT